MVTIPVSVNVDRDLQCRFLAGISDSKSSLPVGYWGPYQCYLGPHDVSMPNGISFRPTALAGSRV